MRIFLLSICLSIATYSAKAQSLITNIERAYTSFEHDEQLKYAISALTVLNAETGELVFSKNDNIGLVAASTLKTITTATALSILGNNFTWTTTLSYSGQISDKGILTGDLIINGAGDPTLGSTRYATTNKNAILNTWIEAIRKAGIKKVTGRVLVDDRLFGTQSLPNGWIWEDIGNYYGASSGAICWDENQFKLIFKPGENVGNPAILVRSDPAVPYLKIVNEVTTGRAGSGDNVYAYSAPYSDLIYVRGTYAIDLKKTIAVSLPDPAFEVAYRLQDTLVGLGVQITKSASSVRKLAIEQQEETKSLLPVTVIDIHQSPPLEQIINAFNQKSINLYGEILIKTLAWKQNKAITTSDGLNVLKDFWQNKLGIDTNTIKMIDGSGLSPAARVTTKSIANILLWSSRQNWFNSFYKSLPINNEMVMKSGSMRGVLAYVGYQKTASGVPLVFAFIVNNYNGSTSNIKQKMFNVLNLLK